MKKPMIKALACALSVAMAVSAPLTVSAAELGDIFSQSAEGTESGTGTVSTTSTNTEVLSNETLQAALLGLTVDNENMNFKMYKGSRDKAALTASILFYIPSEGANAATVASVNSFNAGQYADVLVTLADGETYSIPEAVQRITRTIVWSVEGNAAAIKATELPEQVMVNSKQGGSAKVVATLKNTDYTATSNVFVKEYAETLSFAAMPAEELYVKHTIDMNSLLVKTPATSNDDIAWAVFEKTADGIATTKCAKISNDGVLTLSKETNGKKLIVRAVSEKGAVANTAEFEIGKGNPAAKVEIVAIEGVTDANAIKKGKVNLDFGTKTPVTEVKVTVKMTGKDATKLPTDNIIWDTAKAKNVASVNYIFVEKDEATATKLVTATIKAEGLGKNKNVVAKATSGKKATFKVTVAATLNAILGVEKVDAIYSGQTVQLVAERDPQQNKDALKWEVSGIYNEKGELLNTKNDIKAAKKVATVNAKTGLVSANKKNVAGKIQIKVSHKNTAIEAKTVDVEVKPSNITELTLTPANAVSLYTNQKKNFAITKKTAVEGEEANGYVAWKSSAAKVASVDANDTKAVVKALKKGTAKVSATAVGLKTDRNGAIVKDSKGNAKVATIKSNTTKVTVKQNVTAIQLDKTEISVSPKTKKVAGVATQVETTATVKVKTQLPKGCTKEQITWTIEGADTLTFQDGAKTWTGASVSKSAKATIVVSATAKAGDTAVITAKSASGAKATATVTVYNKTKKVAVDRADKTVTVKASETSAKSLDEIFKIENDTKNTTAAVEGFNEPLSYSVNKSGFVTITDDNKVMGLKKGTVKITAKTPSGKKATITVKVND